MTDRIDVQRNLPGDEIVGERGKDTQELHASSSTKHDFQSHSSRPTKPQLSIAAGQGEYRKHDEDYSYDSASYGGSSRFSARFEVPTRDPITEPKAHMTPGEYFRNRDPLLRTASGSTMRYQRLLSREDKVDLARVRAFDESQNSKKIWIADGERILTSRTKKTLAIFQPCLGI